jgi:hypothetical protein
VKIYVDNNLYKNNKCYKIDVEINVFLNFMTKKVFFGGVMDLETLNKIKVKCNMYNVLFNEKSIVQINVDNTATILDLFNALRTNDKDISNICLDNAKYYKVLDSNYNEKVPYVIVNNKIYWSCEYDQVRLSDFFSTHGISDYSIHILHGMPCEGGIGDIDINYLWDLWDLYIKIFLTIQLSQPLISWISFRLKKIKRYFLRKKVSPGAVFSLIYSKEQWNVHELSALTGIDKNSIKILLKVCRYNWDPNNMVYRKTEESDEIIDKLNNTWEYFAERKDKK